ncbi:ADAMTS-like protein 4 [Leptidea sinapis]|uniref:ADAMTS-like protein 4 n=1 Tax=Leptidea sinapis TaxID=189913 RepID=UPI0021233CA8|nr:ADAMTS-like protein 4 [Leptidea sinapis]XP_050674406.1 ADAMTS-like protein 4 [Leptidea sinapis]
MVSATSLYAVLIIMGVGRASVLSRAGSQEVRCGRRLVSGLFSRPSLPLGYSYITSVPRGACRLNVSEIVPGDNYIALKITNGSYIMNGEFAVSAPGTYEAAGARFIYTRTLGQDSVFALGPILNPVDIMILYTQPNPIIKYEYYTDAMPGEVDIESVTSLPESTASPKHIRRHHGMESHLRVDRYPDVARLAKEKENVIEGIGGTRKFVWKILSYTQCSRSCGGGFQVGKYRCVESSNSGDREVSPVHCSGSAPNGRRRRCSNIPCAPRWRVANWSPCPQCGPANKTRIVGCVQDHSKGITKVSDLQCSQPKPSVTETCNIPNCNSPEVRQVERKRSKPEDNTDVFREGPVYTISVNSSHSDFGPEYSFGVAGWLSTSWSECVGWCVGHGVQTRSVRCADPSGCTPMKSPETSRSCIPKIPCESHDGHWFTGDWSTCTSQCGGRQVRGVLCIGGTGRHLKDSACKTPKPESERSCGEHCRSSWYTSEWGQCTGNCSLGVAIQRRTVICVPRDEQSTSDSECIGRRPHDVQPCSLTCDTSKATKITAKSQRASNDRPSPEHSTPGLSQMKDCEDKLTNCALAVQARLCHYKYYIHNCCNSCK